MGKTPKFKEENDGYPHPPFGGNISVYFFPHSSAPIPTFKKHS